MSSSITTPSTSSARRRRDASEQQALPRSTDAGTNCSTDNNLTRLQLTVRPHPQLLTRKKSSPETSSRSSPSSSHLDLCFHNDYWLEGEAVESDCENSSSTYMAVHFDGEGVTYTRQRDQFPVPRPPNYVIQCDDIDLFDEDDNEDPNPEPFQCGIVSENVSTNMAPVDISVEPRQHLRMRNLCVRIFGVASLTYLTIATICSFWARLRHPQDHPIPHLVGIPVMPPSIESNLTVFDDYFAVRIAYGNLPISWIQELVDPSATYLKESPELPGLKQAPEAISHVCEALLSLGTIWDEYAGFKSPADFDQDSSPKWDLPQEADISQEGTIDVSELCSVTISDLGETGDSTKRMLRWLHYSWPRAALSTFEVLNSRLRRVLKMDQKWPLAALKVLSDTITESSHRAAPGSEHEWDQTAWDQAAWDELQDAKADIVSHRRKIIEARDTLIRVQKDLETVLRIAGTVSSSHVWYHRGAGLAFRWKPGRLTSLIETQSLQNTRRDIDAAIHILGYWLEEEEALLQREEAIRAFIQDLFDHVHDSQSTDVAAFRHGNPWRQSRPATEASNENKWCLYPDCPYYDDVPEENRIDIISVIPQTDDIIERLIDAYRQLKDVTELWKRQWEDVRKSEN